MASEDWRVPRAQRPEPEDYAFDLEKTMRAIVGISTRIPEDAFTAETLGTERAGHGVLIDESGIILTIGYLISEAEEVWIRTHDGHLAPGHVLAYDQETGFGLIQALARLNLPVMPIGESARARTGDPVIVAGAGGLERCVAGHIVAIQEFAGYWEYVIDGAFFTSPAHPNWGGTALIDGRGELIGIGSLHLEQGRDRDGEDDDDEDAESEATSDTDASEHVNMIVPIDLLKPILHELQTYGKRNTPPKPWLGLYATEVDDRLVIVGRSQRGPARKADLRNGDVLVAVAGHAVQSLAGLYRRVQSQGAAGVDIPLTIYRDGKTFDVTVKSSDRTRMFKAPKLH